LHLTSSCNDEYEINKQSQILAPKLRLDKELIGDVKNSKSHWPRGQNAGLGLESLASFDITGTHIVYDMSTGTHIVYDMSPSDVKRSQTPVSHIRLMIFRRDLGVCKCVI